MSGNEKLEKKSWGGARPGSGMKKGQKTYKTIQKEIALRAYQDMVLENLRPLFQKQLWLAMGQTYVYRKEKHGTGASMRIEHVLLEEPHEIADALDTIANSDEQDENEGYVYITTRPPENVTIKDMLDRSLGKAPASLDITSGGEKLPVPLLDRGVSKDNGTTPNTKSE